MDGSAGLRIAYSNKKMHCLLNLKICTKKQEKNIHKCNFFCDFYPFVALLVGIIVHLGFVYVVLKITQTITQSGFGQALCLNICLPLRIKIDIKIPQI